MGSLYIEAHCCVPVLVENLCGMSCSGTCWLWGGTWFQCRQGGFWVSSCLLMFPGIRSSLMFSSVGFKPPASGFQSYSYSSFKTSPSISNNDKTSRLMVKQFSTARDTQRVSRSCIGKRRRRRERGDQEEKRESQNGREQSSQ